MNCCAKVCIKKTLLFTFPFIALVGATLLINAFFLAPPHWDKNFGHLDERYYYGPNAFYLDSSLKNGEYPLWNPLAYCGMPFSADPQASACYPPHLLRGLLTPAFNSYASAVSVHILRCLHWVWAGLGVLLLARRYKISLMAGIAGAFVFMFNIYTIINFTEYYVFPLLVSWMPWILLAAKGAFQTERPALKIVFLVCTVLFFSLSILAGFPQLTLYTGLTLGFFGMLDALLNHRWRLSRNSFLHGFYALGIRAALLLAVAIVSALASSVLLLPAFELGRASARIASAGMDIYALTQDFHWLHLLKCLVVFPGNLWAPVGPRAAGIGSLLMVLVAFGHPRRRDLWTFFLLYLIMADITLGPPFPIGALLHRFDFLNITVSPWRAGPITSLALAMVVAFGVDAAGNAPAKYWLRALRTIVVLAAGSALLAILYYWLKAKPLHDAWYAVWHIPVLTVFIMCVFSWIRYPRVGVALIAILVSAEILTWGAQVMPVYTAPRVSMNLSKRHFGERTNITTSNLRRADIRPNWHMNTLDISMAGYNPLYVGDTRRTICRIGYENYYRGYLKGSDVQAENQLGNLLVKRSFWLARQWVSGTMPGKDALFPAATTVFLPETPPGTELPIPELDRVHVPRSAVSENTERVELGKLDQTRAVTRGNNLELQLPSFDQDFIHSVLYVGYIGVGPVDLRPFCRDEEGRTHLLKRNRISHTRGVERFLEIPLPDCKKNTITLQWPKTAGSGMQLTQAYVLKDLNDEGRHILIQDRTANTISVTVRDLDAPRILTFLDSYYSGWRAWINDEEVDIIKANDAFKAIVLPAGTHSVRFVFQSRSTYIGLVISLTVFAILIGLLIGAMAMYWKSGPQDVPEPTALKSEDTVRKDVKRNDLGVIVGWMRKKGLFVASIVCAGIVTLLIIGEISGINRWRFPGNFTAKESIVSPARIEISTIDDLQSIGLQSSFPLDAAYVLSDDIDAAATTSWFGGAGFQPIGAQSAPFTGSFDGRGHRISGLYINRPDEDNVGLFGVTDANAIIMNTVVDSAEITGYWNVGVLVGNNQGMVSKCSSSGSAAGQDYVGGLVGLNTGAVNQSYASARAAGETRIGGLVGINRGTIAECYAVGRVVGQGAAGGLVGRNYNGTVSNAFWDATSSGISSSDGGQKGDTPQLMLRGTYEDAGWDFTHTWLIEEGRSYPRLSLRPAMEIGSIEELQQIGKDDRFPLNGHYVLMNPIIASATRQWDNGRGFKPIGRKDGADDAALFTGIFDGRGHAIVGLFINRPEEDHVGLFAVIGDKAQVLNVGLTDVAITGRSHVGGLAGQQGGVASGIHVAGRITGTDYVGGLVGGNLGAMEQCYVVGAVSGNSRVGGLIGINRGTLSESYAAATVSGTSLAGGLVGRNYNGVVSDNCFWDMEVSPRIAAGEGIGRNTSQMRQSETFSQKKWDFDATWILDEGQTYPRLRRLSAPSLK